MEQLTTSSKPATATLLILTALTLFDCASSSGGRRLALNPGLKDDRQAERLLSAMTDGAVQTGLVSWYGPQFHGRRTANGEVFDMDGISAAHKTLPFDTLLEVKNLDNGRTLEVRVNDRGPFIRGRILDLSRGAARKIGLIGAGVARVEIRIVRLPSKRQTFASREAPRDLTAPAPTNDGSWVQAGAFRDRQRAQTLANSLHGEDSRFAVFNQHGWYRVQARLSSHKEAQELLNALQKRNIKTILVHPN